MCIYKTGRDEFFFSIIFFWYRVCKFLWKAATQDPHTRENNSVGGKSCGVVRALESPDNLEAGKVLRGNHCLPPTCLCIRVSVWFLFVCLFVRQCIWLYICMCISSNVYLYVCLSICLLSCMFVYLLCLFLCACFCLSVYLVVCLSVYLF